MITVGLLLVVLVYLLAGIRMIHPNERGVKILKGSSGRKAVGPGLVFVPLFFATVQRVSIEPFTVSLPPQSAITKDEIPIQLQSSLKAYVVDPKIATTKVRDWRIYLTSLLQDLIKDGLEELDFDNLEEQFPAWTLSIRKQLDRRANEIGVAIEELQVSNLSPRSRPA